MNTVVQKAMLDDRTIVLHQGYFAKRNGLDWAFAVLVFAGGLYALGLYGSFMDVYEKGILLGAVPSVIALCWFLIEIFNFLYLITKENFVGTKM